MTHTGLLHSGTPNLSDDKRYFFSVYYNISWLKHTDTFDGPNCAQLKVGAGPLRPRAAFLAKTITCRLGRTPGSNVLMRSGGSSGQVTMLKPRPRPVLRGFDENRQGACKVNSGNQCDSILAQQCFSVEQA